MGRNDHIVTVFSAKILVVALHTHYLVSLEVEGLRSAQHILCYNATNAVVVVQHVFRLFVVVGQIGCAQLAACPLMGEEALDEQHGPRLGAMSVLVGIAVEEVEQLV